MKKYFGENSSRLKPEKLYHRSLTGLGEMAQGFVVKMGNCLLRGGFQWKEGYALLFSSSAWILFTIFIFLLMFIFVLTPFDT